MRRKTEQYATEQITLAAAFGLADPARWVDPDVTRLALAEWQRMGCPPDLWPLTLYRDGIEPVTFAGPDELQAATVAGFG